MWQKIKRTITKSNEIAELWVGTQYEGQIHIHRDQLIESIESRDSKIIKDALDRLVRLLNWAEKEYEKIDEF